MLYSFPFWCGANRGNLLFSKAMSKYFRFECSLPVPAGICGHLSISQFFTVDKSLRRFWCTCMTVFSASSWDNWTFFPFYPHISRASHSLPSSNVLLGIISGFAETFFAVFNIESLEAWNTEVPHEQGTRHKIIKKFNAVSLRYLLK